MALERWPLRPPTLGLVASNFMLGEAGTTCPRMRFRPCERPVAEAATAPKAFPVPRMREVFRQQFMWQKGKLRWAESFRAAGSRGRATAQMMGTGCLHVA